ncbi:glycosyltransferase family 4 protein [Candidatus Saccharibacteria bacterium]|nr:glycosyltransferase family 4 protein [Candidatus Saccharibacteria bacterium]
MANQSRLKIGLVLDTSLDQPDGVQQYVIAIGEWLRSQKHDVHYLVGESHRTDLQNVHSLAKNIKVRFNGNRTTIPLPTNRKALKQFLDKERFDVLHVQMPHSPFMSQRLILAAPSTTAIIGTFHIAPYNKLVTIGNTLLGWWLGPSLKRFDKVVSVSQAGADFAEDTFGLATEVLPNVIDYQRFNTAKPLDKYANSKVKILFLGRLVPRKGAELLMQAVARLTKQSNVPAFEVIICGKGPQSSKIEGFIRKNKLEDIVHMEGFVSEADKPRYYASADISVFPSTGGESFGIVLLEAMASGKAAVLAGDNPGYRTVMSPRSEQLFDPHNAAALTDMLGQYVRHKRIRERAQKWGASYTASFDIQLVGEKLEEIYREALRKRR